MHDASAEAFSVSVVNSQADSGTFFYFWIADAIAMIILIWILKCLKGSFESFESCFKFFFCHVERREESFYFVACAYEKELVFDGFADNRALETVLHHHADEETFTSYKLDLVVLFCKSIEFIEKICAHFVYV